MARWVLPVCFVAACGFDAGGVGTSPASSGPSGMDESSTAASATAGMTGAATSATTSTSTTTTGDTSGSADSSDGSTSADTTTTDDGTTGPAIGPVCGGFVWDAQMDVDPTTLDNNGDAIPDWEFNDGEFPDATLVDGIWQAPAEALVRTMPANAFTTRVVASVRLRAIATSNRGATFFVNLAQEGGSVTRLWLNVGIDESGAQVASVGGFVADMMPMTLINVVDLGTDFIDATLDADPTTGTVAVTIAGVDLGEVMLPSYAGNAAPSAGVGARTVAAEIDSVTIELCPP